MKNITRVLIIALCPINISYTHAGWLIGLEEVKAIGNGIRDGLEKFGHELGSHLEGTAKILGPEAAPALKTFASGVDKLGTAFCGGMVILGVHRIYKIGEDIYIRRNPTKEQQAREDEAAERNNILKSKQEYRECFLKNMNGSRNAADTPVACEASASMFAAMAGIEKMKAMTDNFNQAYPRR